MAKKEQKGKEKNAWDRFVLWMRSNEKVVMVVLLLLVAPLFAFTGPVTQFFSPSPGEGEVARVYGQRVTQAEVDSARDFLPAVLSVGPFETLTDVALTLSRDLNPIHFYAYREKARRLGIRVSDDELGDHIRTAWRWQKAREKGEFPQMEKLLEDDTFDGKEWGRMVSGSLARFGRRTGTRVLRDFEEMMRDVRAIAKLETYVLSAVQVTPREVYEAYRREEQKRKLSWVEAKPDDLLEEKLRAGVKEEELELFYQANPESFRRQLAVRAAYLLLPREHFAKEAEKSITEDGLREAYLGNRHLYRRATILSDEALFALRTPEEKEAFEAKLFLPFEEVKERARQKLIEEKANELEQSLAAGLRSRLFPAGTDRPATVEQLLGEYPFLKSGQTEFAEEKEAEKVFAEAYHATTVSGWFRQAAEDARTGKRSRIDPPEVAPVLADDRGRVLFTRVETRPADIPRLKEVREEVKARLVRERALEAVSKALAKVSGEINDGKRGLAEAADVELEVELAGGEKVLLKTGKLDTARLHAARAERGGAIRTFRPEEKGEGKTPEGGGEGEEEEAAEEAELLGVRHADSKAILDVGFSLESEGKTAVGTAEEEKACYLVRLDGILHPDPAGFDKRRKFVALRLLREKRVDYFTRWRSKLFEEAFGLPSAEPEVKDAAAGD